MGTRGRAIAVALVVASVGAVAAVDRARLHDAVDDARAEARHATHQIETLRASTPPPNDDVAKIKARVDVVTRDLARVEAVCVRAKIDQERARLEGANAGSNYQSAAFYGTLLSMIDAICGQPER